MRKFWCRSCSCRVPVVLGGFVSRMGPPVSDGAGVPWVLTGTHQRDAPSRQDDGDIRAPTLSGWCCHGRHVVMVVSESLHVLPSNKRSVSNKSTSLPGCMYVLFFPSVSSSLAESLPLPSLLALSPLLYCLSASLSLSLSPISFVAPVPVVFSRFALPLCCPKSFNYDLLWVLSLCVSCFLICYLCAWSVFFIFSRI